MNAPVPIMLALGEQLILPAMLEIAALVLVVYPAALWVLANNRDQSHRRSVVSWAVVLTLVCGAGVVATLKDFSWPPEAGDLFGLLIWAVPAACGVIALVKIVRRVRP